MDWYDKAEAQIEKDYDDGVTNIISDIERTEMHHKCPACDKKLECSAGRSAHPSNWYCSDQINCGWYAGKSHNIETMRKYHTPECAGSGQLLKCVTCGKGPSKEGHDGCLGTLPGQIMNACCGHGQVPGAYIQYNNGKRIAGEEAIAEQARLLKLT